MRFPAAILAFISLALASAAWAQETAQLQIQFLDDVKPLSAGKEIRFEVSGTLGGNTIKVDIATLDFQLTPAGWGEVKPGADKTTGVIVVKQLFSDGGIFDETEYAVKASFKGEGSGSFKNKNRFRLTTGLGMIELKCWYSGDNSQWKEFDGRSLAKLTPASFTVSDPSLLSIVQMDGAFCAKVLKAAKARPTVTVTFPNGDKATTTIDLSCFCQAPEEAPEASAGAFETVRAQMAALRKELGLLDTFEGNTWLQAEDKRNTLRRGLSLVRSQIEHGQFGAGERASLQSDYNDLVDLACGKPIVYHEGGAGGPGPKLTMRLVDDAERAKMRFGN